MMRRTAACAGLALALYLSSWISLDSRPGKVTQDLSLDGIDVVVVQRGSATVRFTSKPPAASYDPAGVGRLLEHRQGRVLVLWPEAEGSPSLRLNLPPTTRRLVVEGANIEVERDVEMSALEVRTRLGLSWQGNIRSLRIVDLAEPRDCNTWSCGDDLAIRNGSIGKLRISTRQGRVELSHPDGIGRATFAFGPDARYLQGEARRRPDLRIVPWRAGIMGNPDPDPEQEPR